MAKKKNESVSIEVMEVQRGELKFYVKGTEPLILNRLSEKARRELLLPKGKKTAADKAMNLKHNPIQEFHDAPHYLAPGAGADKAPTLLALPCTSFKNAMLTAALDMEGVTKAAIGRQVYVPGEYTPVYGIPKLYMRPVRSADMNRTPDIRTRVILPEWCCELTVQFAKPILREKPVANLLAAAGFMSGMGDFRPEKGKGTNGQFVLVGDGDKDFKRIVKNGGRAQQIEAMQAAEAYDDETSELLSWFTGEAHNRGWAFDDTGAAYQPETSDNGKAKA